MNTGRWVTYWREEPLEVDGVIEGSWGQWAIEVKTGSFQPKDLSGLLEFAKRYKGFRALVVCGPGFEPIAARADVAAITWQEFLLKGPPWAPDLPTPSTSG